MDYGELAQDAIVWASQHGLVVGLGGSAPEVALVHAPLAALPVPFPTRRFKQAKAVMTTFNSLVDAISRDEPYLESTLHAAAQYDDFTARLLKLLVVTRADRQAVAAAGQEIVLGIHRSDYMLDGPSGKFLQVEINTIASSFGCLSTITSQMHRYILKRAAPPAAYAQHLANLPDNEATRLITDAMAKAVQLYGVADAVMVMVVQPGERNAYDQQWLSTVLFENYGIRTLRRTLKQIQEQGRVDETGHLRIGSAVAAVVYFRAGYTPNDYTGEEEWQARELIERSRAAKCPTVAYQLAGTKKVQQDLALPGELERFLEDKSLADQLREVFAGLWGLEHPEDPEIAAVIQQALQDPDSFVLKPQREGGGNNLYGEDLRAKLREGRGLAAYVLMQRIKPPPQRSVLVRLGKWQLEETVSELGIYGTYVRHGDKVHVNEEAGHLVRTKQSSSNEGGVAAGFAVLDSPYLVKDGERPPSLLDLL